MRKAKVFVTRIIPEPGMQAVRDTVDATVWPEELPPPREVVLDGVRGCDGILSLLTTPIDQEVMDAAGPQLKVVSNYAVGFDNVDTDTATARNIPVGHTPDVLTDTTADFAFALLMAAARRVTEGSRYVLEGKWQTWGPSLLLGQDITGATLGIVGFGRIGKGMARRASGFGMDILFADDWVAADDPAAVAMGARKVDLDTLLAESDFVSAHTPLTPETTHLFDAAAFAKMKSTSILVNTARGPLVNSDDLHAALKSGDILYAALDVTEPEPLPPDSPLLELDNIIVVPHIASASVATRARMSEIAAANLVAGLEGRRLPHCANPEVYG